MSYASQYNAVLLSCHFYSAFFPASFLRMMVVIIFSLKTKNMHYNQSCAAKGEHGSRHRQLLNRTMQRAAVNVYRTENSFEMLVFAPGRIKEHFKLDVKDEENTFKVRLVIDLFHHVEF